MWLPKLDLCQNVPKSKRTHPSQNVPALKTNTKTILNCDSVIRFSTTKPGDSIPLNIITGMTCELNGLH